MNRILSSSYGGQAISITFEGEKDFIEKGFNGLLNHGASPALSYFHNFKYLVTTQAKLERAYRQEGETLRLTQIWRGVRAAGKTIASITMEEEANFHLDAAEFGAQYAAQKLSQVEKTGFMEEITKSRNSTFSSVEY